jgi:YggT family protein
MIAAILDIILGAIYWVLLPAALLRFYMQWLSAPFRNPVGRFICAVTDWIVMPLRRVFRGVNYDWASLIAAYVIVLARPLLMDVLLLRFAIFSSRIVATIWLIGSVFDLLEAAIWVLFGVLIVYAVLSWVAREQTSVSDLLARMVNPWLRPLRRRMPLVGGVDLSPMVLSVLLMILLQVLYWLRIEAVSLIPRM